MQGLRKGIVLAGGLSTRLLPASLPFSKQLIPVFDKPMVYYPLASLMQADIRDILVISTPRDRELYERLLGNGESLGLSISYAIQDRPVGLAHAFILGEDFVGDSPSALVLGDNLLHGHSWQTLLRIASSKISMASIFAYEVSDPSRYGVVNFQMGLPVSLEEKPAVPRSNLAIPGIYFYPRGVCQYARSLAPSARGELEITDLNSRYLAEGSLHVWHVARGNAWLDMGTHQSLLDASSYIATIQRRQGVYIACLEEIAYDRGWISRDQLALAAESYGASDYGAYLRRVLQEPRHLQ